MRRAFVLRRGALAGALVSVALTSPPVAAQPFDYMPVGQLVAGSGEGTTDATVFAPGMRFPMEEGPAFANSQVYNPGGYLGPDGGQCDAVNYNYPWWDNYCEIRSWNMPLCPAGTGHQGQDIRPGTCDKDTHWAVAAADGTITNVGSYSVYLTAPDGTRFDYLHMSNVQVSVGEDVARGDRLGYVSNEFGGTPTTIHLHFNIRQTVDGVGSVYVPPYTSLVGAYQALIGGTGGPLAGAVDTVACDTGILGWAQSTTPETPVDVVLYFDGTPEDGMTIGHPVLAALEGSCDGNACDNGFRIGLPLSLMDGQTHDLVATALDGLSGVEPVLDGTPAEFSCVFEAPALPRRAISEGAWEQWRFSAFWDVAEVSSGEIDGLAEGAALPELPELVLEGEQIWLIDGGKRRYVSADAMVAWDFYPGFAESISAAELEAIERAADLPPRPIIVRDNLGGDVFLLDDPTQPPIVDTDPGTGGFGGAGGNEADPAGDADDGCGCRTPGGGSSGDERAAWIAAAMLGLWAGRRRRARD